HAAVLISARVLALNPDHLEVQKQATLGLASVEHALGLSREALDRLNRFASEAKLSPSNLVELELQRCKAADFTGDYSQMERAAQSAFDLANASSLVRESIEATAALGLSQCRVGNRNSGLLQLIKASARARRHKMTDTISLTH